MLQQEQINLILQFDSISCREQEASSIVSKITGREITTVLDPTLMVAPDFWHGIADEATFIKKEKYILSDFLHTDYYQDSIPYDYIQNGYAQTLFIAAFFPIYSNGIFLYLNDL